MVCPRFAKNVSFAAFWSAAFRLLGLGDGDGLIEEGGAGDDVRSEECRVDARDFRRDWDDDGRLGSLNEGGGAEGCHSLSSISLDS